MITAVILFGVLYLGIASGLFYSIAHDAIRGYTDIGRVRALLVCLFWPVAVAVYMLAGTWNFVFDAVEDFAYTVARGWKKMKW